MKLYRVQDKEGRGPFKPGFSIKWLDGDVFPDPKLKPIMEDFPNIKFRANRFHGCACKSIDQLKRWFSPTEYEILKQLGYEAVVFDADVIAESDVQVVFASKTKPKVSIINLYGNSK